MARAALEWGMRDLAKAADISPNTVMRFETGRNEPNTLTLNAAFEAAGLIFIDADETMGEGVRLKASAEAREPDKDPGKPKARAIKEASAE
jgi:transcriptional regulator with XRE-family HTH domain